MSLGLPDVGQRKIIKKVLEKNGFKEFYADDMINAHFQKGSRLFHFPIDKRITPAIMEFVIQESGISKQKFLHDYYFFAGNQ